MGGSWRYIVWAVVLAIIGYYWLSQAQNTGPKRISYTQFKDDIRQGEIAKVVFKGQEVIATLREKKSEGEKGEKTGKETGEKEGKGTKEGPAGKKTSKPPQRVETTLLPMNDPDLVPLLVKHDVKITAESTKGSPWASILIWVLPWVLIIGFFYYTSRAAQKQLAGGGPGGIFSFGRSKAKRFQKTDSDVRFSDVAGLENAKRDMHEIIDFLKDPQRFRAIGAKIPKGILLMGPPGTGKTLLSRAVAGEAEVPFYSISGSEFIEMFVGVGASRVRDMFESAKKDGPSIIFIDEIDSVGRARGTGLGGGHDEREQTLNQILAEMDGFTPQHMVVVIAATNRPDVLDPALLRPGRFDRKITLDLPRKEARRQILAVHTRGIPLADDVDLGNVAARTVGFSGADLQNLANEAALLAGREKKEKVDAAAFDQARDRVMLGPERESLLDEEGRRQVAFHEAGHALLTFLLPHTDPLAKVTIIPRGRALGATEQLPEEERVNMRESYLKDRIVVMLGGRASEHLVFGEVSNGAEEDLKQATKLARHMISNWGMNEKLGPVAFRRGEDHLFLGREMAQQRDFSEHTAQLIDDEVRELLSTLDERAAELLGEHRDQLQALAEGLVEHEILEAAQIREIIGIGR